MIAQTIKRLVLFAAMLCGGLVIAKQPAESAKIDATLEAYWKTKGVQPAPIVDDEIFLRRTYLTIAGRIPTYEEAQVWLASKDAHKREQLIDELIDSEGFVSNQFNLWADAMRIRTTGREGNVSGGKYFVPWLKNQLRSNKPYNEWVREILSAEGAPWETPPSAYFLRDQGMPLDNMALTMQVFLGTQMQCAQCHDHPTDVWSRRDFYEMAAFRYAVDTRINYDKMEEMKPLLEELKKRKYDELSEKDKKRLNGYKLLNSAGRDLFNNLRWQTTRTNRKLKFPHDYQYDDVKAKSLVDPHTIFGETPDSKEMSADERVEFYASWVTSPENPRFTTVVANRLWKSAMGRGALEPIDDLRNDSKSAVPGLDEQLTEIMRSVNFDLKAYYRIILMTDFFQREAVVFDSERPGEYHYTGPILRRLSAEQMWDSYVVLLNPDIDERPKNYEDPLPQPPSTVQIMENFTPQQMADYLESAEVAWQERQEARTAFYKVRSDPEMADTEEYKTLRDAHRAAEKKWRSYSKVDTAMSMMGTMTEQDANDGKDKKPGKKLAWWEKNLNRAADLQSPSNVDHWLRIFGQSDRDIVDNSDDSSTVNQMLMMLNSGQTNDALTQHADPVKRAKNTKDINQALEMLTLGFLTRYPTEKEKEYIAAQWEKDPNKARARMAWAMVNTQEFLFIQ